jgi:N-terminal domain of cytochrome oxidase-cbb3, FixP
MAEDFDNVNIEDLEAKDTARKIPHGWLILFWGLILWGIYYLAMYSPVISGWTQEKAYEESVTK